MRWLGRRRNRRLRQHLGVLGVTWAVYEVDQAYDLMHGEGILHTCEYNSEDTTRCVEFWFFVQSEHFVALNKLYSPLAVK